jgi:hypothetical protein
MNDFIDIMSPPDWCSVAVIVQQMHDKKVPACSLVKIRSMWSGRGLILWVYPQIYCFAKLHARPFDKDMHSECGNDQ